MQVQDKEIACFPLYSFWDFFSPPKKFKMHFKVDVMKILGADNAFSSQSVSSLLPSRSQFPWNQREITAENLREAGSWYKTLEFINPIIDRAFKNKTKQKKTKHQENKETKPKRLTGKISYATLEIWKSLMRNLYLNFVLTVKAL